MELRQRGPSGLGLRPFASKVTVVLSLAADPGRMWKRLDAKVRNQVRKATNSGLTVTWHGIDALDDFYAVFSVNMRDLGSPVHHRRFFAGMLEEFAGSMRLVLVRYGATTVAGAVCMWFRDTVLVPWASSLRAYRSRCPSNLLYWEVIRSACDKGVRWLDFGRSTPGSGTYRFKEQWGGYAEPLNWECSGTGGAGASMVDTSDPRRRWMVGAWQRLPVAVATTLGPVLRKRLSN
jgi:FemAB-related protein (PEP-CTERM system-associated)